MPEPRDSGVTLRITFSPVNNAATLTTGILMLAAFGLAPACSSNTSSGDGGGGDAGAGVAGTGNAGSGGESGGSAGSGTGGSGTGGTGGSGTGGVGGGGPDAGPPPAAGWPVGIPVPSFGVDETVESVYGSDDYFTYYVDNRGPCDDGTNGTMAQPRCTIPFSSVAAGDVVFIAGGTYLHGDIWMPVTATATAPLFIRGPSTGDKPIIDGDTPAGARFDMAAEYVIIENIDFRRTRVLMEAASQFVSFRDNIVSDHPDRSGVSARGSNIVVLRNEIHHFQGANRLGVAGACGASFIWVVSNLIHHNAEDSVQFGHGCQADRVHDLFIGGNVMHSDRENAVDLKWVRDVVVSQNRVFGYRTAATDQEFCYDDGSRCDPPGFHGSGSDGSAMVIGSDGVSENVWVLLNDVSDSQRGIRNEESTVSWLFGNVVHDIVDAGVVLEKQGDVRIVGNTFFDMATGVDQLRDAFTVSIDNNVFALLSDRALDVSAPAVASASFLRNNLFEGPSVEIRWDATFTIASAADFSQLTLGTVAGNAVGDPAFVDSAGGDFHLGPGSAAVDVGLPSATTAVCDAFMTRFGLDICVDTEGNPRAGTIDAGALERP